METRTALNTHFYLNSWYGNFVETHNFRRVSDGSPELNCEFSVFYAIPFDIFQIDEDKDE